MGVPGKFDSYLPFKITEIKMKLKIYLQEAYEELVYKVTWPTWKELQSSALVVMVASFIISLVIFVMDLGFRNIMSFIYGLFY
jgi:preprotein translocase subunit SecE